MRYAFAPLLLTLFAAAPPAAPKPIKVPGDFAKIQDAIDSAGSDDTIIVSKGTYLENLVIQNKHDLKILGKGFPIIDASGGNIGISFVTSFDNVLSGFDVRHAQTVGISLQDSHDNKILKCKVTDTGADGILLDNSHDETIQQCTVTDIGAVGIDLGKGVLACHDVLVTKNKVADTGGAAIYVHGNNNLIAKNNIDDFGGYGVEIDATGGFSNEISKNKITNGGFGGVKVGGGNDNTIESNHVILVGFEGILVDGTDQTIRKNQLQDTHTHGLVVAATATNITVDSNKSVKSTHDGVRIEGDSSVFTKNHVTQAGADGFHIVAGATGNTLDKNTAAKSTNLDANEENGAGVNTFTANHFKNSNLP
jgi:parallel beta-helix repeat protein